MKKAIFAVLSLGLFLSTSFASAEKLAPVYSKYFLKTYLESRTAFLQIAKDLRGAFPKTEITNYPVKSKSEDGTLFVDLVHVPPTHPNKNAGLVIVISGVHGAEAFAASATQRFMMDQLLLKKQAEPPLDTENTGYLFIHALNPWGYQHGRRVTESNVDLNRNFSTSSELFQTKNEGYGKIYGALNPPGKASHSFFSHLGLFGNFGVYSLIYKIDETLKNGLSSVGDLSKLRQAALSGQYEYPKGVYFGGLTFEPQVELLKNILLTESEPYQKVFVLDIHTGYGKKGFMHLYPNPPGAFGVDKALIEARWKKVFGNYPLGTGSDGYTADGDCSTYAAQVLKEKIVVPMLIEFGTVNSESVKGMSISLTRTVRESQLYFHGAKSPRDAQLIRRDYRELFYPSDLKWRRDVMAQIEKHIPGFIDRFTRDVNE